MKLTDVPRIALWTLTIALGCASKGGAPQEQEQGSAAARSTSPQASAAADSAHDFRWTGTVASGKALSVHNINGAIEVTPSPDDTVSVHARKDGPASARAEVRIEVREHDGGVSVCTLYPGMTMGDDGRCSGKAHDTGDVDVQFTVAVPAGVGFVGRTVNGSVKTEALPGEVEASTVNGSVKIGAAGTARAKAVNGSISVEISDPESTAPLSFETVNGSITLALPSAANADLRASTVHGKIRTDFGLPVKTGMGPGASVRGQLGSGGRTIELATVNGSIRIAKTDS